MSEKNRKSHKNSAARKQQAISAQKPRKPKAIDRNEEPYWDALIELRSYSDWNKADLQLAVYLAKQKYALYKLHEQVSREGYLITHKNGFLGAHPALSIIKELEKRVLQLSRDLHVHASATLGRARDTGANARADQAIKDAAQQAEDDDDLIARSGKVAKIR